MSVMDDKIPEEDWRPLTEEDKDMTTKSSPSTPSSTMSPLKSIAARTTAKTPTVAVVEAATFKNSKLPKSSHRISFRQELDDSEDDTPRMTARDLRVSDDQDDDDDDYEYDEDHDGISDNHSNKKKKHNSKGDTTNPPKKYSRRISAGKANPIRDLGIVMGCFIGLYLIANTFSDFVAPPKEDGMVKPIDRKSKIEQIQEAIGELMKVQARPYYENPSRSNDIPCPIILHPSRIPKSGWGFYAGQDYAVGQEIMILAPPSWPIRVNHENDGESSTFLSVTPEAIMFKHHPTLVNIKSSKPLWTAITSDIDEMSTTSSSATGTISIQATRPIEKGEELFLEFDQHIHSIMPDWFDHIIPTLFDYNEATEILHEARTQIRDPRGPRGKKLAKHQSVVGAAIQMIQHVVGRYRPAAAKLMGQTIISLAQYRGTAADVHSLELGLKSIPWVQLTMTGMCYTDVAIALEIIDTTNDDQEETSDHVTRLSRVATVHAVPKGQPFHPIPILLQHVGSTVDVKPPSDETKGNDVECIDDTSTTSSGTCSSNAMTSTIRQDDTKRCWSWSPDQNIKMKVCPLEDSFLSNLIRMGTRGTVGEKNSDQGTTVVPPPPPIPNTRLQWSQLKQATRVVGSQWIPSNEMKDQLELLLLMDLVAIEDLKAGDELILAMDIDSTTGQWVLSSDLIPSHWK